MPKEKEITILCGRYGCGKTNLAVNLAMERARAGARVTLVDLDVINPYFRSSDYKAPLEAAGVRVIAPAYAGTTLDLPALLPEIAGALDGGGHVLADAGGDDAGAVALGGFYEKLRHTDYELLFVVNQRRSLTGDPAEEAALLRAVERVTRLRATGVANNAHLKGETTPALIRAALPYAREAARLAGLPLKLTTAPRALADALSDIENLYPVDIYVRTPWERE